MSRERMSEKFCLGWGLNLAMHIRYSLQYNTITAPILPPYVYCVGAAFAMAILSVYMSR